MSTSTKQTMQGVPGIPLAALDAIPDQNTRQVLRAFVDGWHVRNGNSGAGGRRFVTVDELSGVNQTAQRALTVAQQTGNGAGGAGSLQPGEISRVITDLQAAIMESQLWKELGERIEFLDISREEDAAKLETEVQQRLEADRAIVQSTTTQFAVITGNVAALQTQYTTTANNVAALSRSLTTLQVQVGQNSTLLQQEMQARINADQDMYAKYSVKIDMNGYVTGFGLMSTSNNSVPLSEFIVRADRFAIGSPEGPGITPRIPFIVTTTPKTLNGQVVPVGVYMDEAAIQNGSINSLKVGYAQIDTLHVVRGSVTSMQYASGGVSGVAGGGSTRVLSMGIDMGTAANPSGVTVIASCTMMSVVDDATGYLRLRRRSDGVQIGFAWVSLFQGFTSTLVIFGFDSAPHTNINTYDLFAESPTSGPGANIPFSVDWSSMVATGGKR